MIFLNKALEEEASHWHLGSEARDHQEQMPEEGVGLFNPKIYNKPTQMEQREWGGWGETWSEWVTEEPEEMIQKQYRQHFGRTEKRSGSCTPEPGCSLWCQVSCASPSNLPSTDTLESGFSNAFDSYLSYITLWNEISNTLVGFDAENSKQMEVQAETEQESKAREKSMNGLGEDK